MHVSRSEDFLRYVLESFSLLSISWCFVHYCPKKAHLRTLKETNPAFVVWTSEGTNEAKTWDPNEFVPKFYVGIMQKAHMWVKGNWEPYIGPTS